MALNHPKNHQQLSVSTPPFSLLHHGVLSASTTCNTNACPNNDCHLRQADLPDQPLLRTRAFAYSLWNSSFTGALCWWSINYWGPGWGAGASGPNSYSGSVLYPPAFKPTAFLPVAAPRPRSSLRWEALLDGLFDLERATLLEKGIAAAAAAAAAAGASAPPPAARAAAVAAGRAALAGIRHIVWAAPVTDDLTVQPFTVDAKLVDRHQDAVAAAIEALARVV